MINPFAKAKGTVLSAYDSTIRNNSTAHNAVFFVIYWQESNRKFQIPLDRM